MWAEEASPQPFYVVNFPNKAKWTITFHNFFTEV